MHKTYMKKNIHYTLEKGGSGWIQGPKSTYRPFVNISLGRRNFVIVEKNGISGEANEYFTISFLLVNYKHHQ